MASLCSCVFEFKSGLKAFMAVEFKSNYNLSNVIGLNCPGPEWIQFWHGLWMLRESFSDRTLIHHQTTFEENPISTYPVEAFALLSILELYNDKHVNFTELGSGRAPWCLTVAAAYRYKLTQRLLASYFVLALEAEPTHFSWTKEHLEAQYINGMAMQGAIGATVGSVRFMATTNPAAHMGQACRADGNIEVPMTTIDTLREKTQLKKMHIIHMDVQGAEVDAIKGARRSIADQSIDFLIIGTHGYELEEKLKHLLSPYFELSLEIPQGKQVELPWLDQRVRAHDDGLQVWQRLSFKL